jgi:hypothetical protein
VPVSRVASLVSSDWLAEPRVPVKATSNPPVMSSSAVTATLPEPIELRAIRAVWIWAAVASKFSAAVVWPP